MLRRPTSALTMCRVIYAFSSASAFASALHLRRFVVMLSFFKTKKENKEKKNHSNQMSWH